MKQKHTLTPVEEADMQKAKQKTSAVRERSRSFRAHGHHGEADEGGRGKRPMQICGEWWAAGRKTVEHFLDGETDE